MSSAIRPAFHEEQQPMKGFEATFVYHLEHLRGQVMLIKNKFLPKKPVE